MSLSLGLLAQSLVALVPTGDSVAAPDSTLKQPPPQVWATQAASAGHSILIVLPDSAKKRPKAVEYSHGFEVRSDIHKFTSYATGPLLLAQYLSGESILHKGSEAPSWAQDIHQPVSMMLGGVFLMNTVTGVWNLAESKGDPAGKTRRTVHGALMLLADAGFAYSAAIAPSIEDIDQRIAEGQRGGWTDHKKFAMASIGVATVGYLMMYIWKD
jgi:hypothetical protein